MKYIPGDIITFISPLTNTKMKAKIVDLDGIYQCYILKFIKPKYLMGNKWSYAFIDTHSELWRRK
jgi:hypothetical protein